MLHTSPSKSRTFRSLLVQFPCLLAFLLLPFYLFLLERMGDGDQAQ